MILSKLIRRRPCLSGELRVEIFCGNVERALLAAVEKKPIVMRPRGENGKEAERGRKEAKTFLARLFLKMAREPDETQARQHIEWGSRDDFIALTKINDGVENGDENRQQQRARENKMMKTLGLEFDTDATKPGANDRQQTMTTKKKEGAANE